MGAGLPEWMLDAKTPTEVTGVPRTPVEEPRLGVDVSATAEGTPIATVWWRSGTR
jgi:hypothetical protein